jgi:hypothetical protein
MVARARKRLRRRPLLVAVLKQLPHFRGESSSYCAGCRAWVQVRSNGQMECIVDEALRIQ